jgi:thiamine-phosphate pyrophosphorylase
MLHKLQYISQGADGTEHVRNIHRALEAGVQWVQLRLKNTDQKTYILHGLAVRDLCDQYKATFIVNDHPAVALECYADGVHLGLNDMDVKAARQIMGKKIIGGTANTMNDVIQRYAEKVDYIGLGPFRFTPTKEKLSPLLGIEGYKKIVEEAGRFEKQIPIYAIGGIEGNDVEEIMQTGIHGIAVSGLITHHSRREELVRELKILLNHA